jgi:heavy metal translocating P-type ATPase
LVSETNVMDNGSMLTRFLRVATLGVAAGGLAIGGVAWALGATGLADALWAGATLIVLVPLAGGVLKDLYRREIGVDVIALLAMTGALLLGEYFAGVVIGLMLSGGEALEAYAGSRARAELSSLVSRAPQEAHLRDGRALRDIPVGDVKPGEVLVIKPGEVVPVDGIVEGSVAVLDEAALTGEALPVERLPGDRVRSGVLNAGTPFDIRATASVEESTYTGIIRLVREAQRAKAPLVRLADRYSVGFLLLTVMMAAVAWMISGDARRALAVVVVATPCPLILATPVAMVGGISRAARRGIIVKGGGVLETLGRTRVLLFDKTGTLTEGIPRLTDMTSTRLESDELLRYAASVDQVSPHILAAGLVAAARTRDLQLVFPSNVKEEPGVGIEGEVEGLSIRVGKLSWVVKDSAAPPWARRIRRRATYEGASTVFVAIGGELMGAAVFEDRLRANSARTIRLLRQRGVRRIVLVTGDHADVAERVGAAIGVDRVLADRSPADKVNAVLVEHGSGSVVMVGDGVNDAPALAAADAGIAMGARGATASSETADAVIIVDDLARVGEAIAISQRSRRIALQSIFLGMGLSTIGMVFATAGLLVPVAGALIQEIIDVAAISNALRSLRDGASHLRRPGGTESTRFRAEHRDLLPAVDRLRDVADRLDWLDRAKGRAELRDVYDFLVEKLLPHEREEEEVLYPIVAGVLGGEDPTGAMTRTHVEITHLVKLLGRSIDDLGDEGPSDDDLPELRRVLYGLHAILRLHFAQEEEAYSALGADEGGALDDRAGLSADSLSPTGP